MLQDKQQEVAFFDRHADKEAYDVFTPQSNARLVQAFVRLTGLPPGSKVVDLGCGSGIFSELLRQAGYTVVGVDISPKLIERGKTLYPGVEFVVADVETLPFADESFDGALLSGLIHHFPDPHLLMKETHRILRPDGSFMAFDPNRLNPFMYLYRDRSSPLYSSVGVTPNERPILAKHIATLCHEQGFEVTTQYQARLSYRYVASPLTRIFLPIYNAIDFALFSLPFMAPLRPFVLTSGRKSA